MTKIDHVALTTSDPQKAAEWYCENFDATLLYSDDTWAMVQFENIKLAFVIKTQHPAHIAFEVDQFDETDRTKKHRDGSVSVYKNDPWKNIYELIQYESEE